MEMATGFKNTQKIIANTNQQKQCMQTNNAAKKKTKTSKYNAVGKDNNITEQQQQQKIKISIKNKLKNLKFLINLYLNIILCISKIKQNYSMLKLNNYQQNCIIKWLENATIFNITLQFIRKIILNFLRKFKIHSGLIENVKIIKYLHIVRHFVGICLIRLISLKRLQQIPENHQEKQEKLLMWQVVGNAEKTNQTKSYSNNIKSILSSNHEKEEETWSLCNNNLSQIVGYSQNGKNCCYLTSKYIDNEKSMLEIKKREFYQFGNSQYKSSYHHLIRKSACQIVGNIHNHQYDSSFLISKYVESTTKKINWQQVGNSKYYRKNINFLNCKVKKPRLSRKRKSKCQIVGYARNCVLKQIFTERYLTKRRIEENEIGNSFYINEKEKEKSQFYLNHMHKVEYNRVGNSQNCRNGNYYLPRRNVKEVDVPNVKEGECHLVGNSQNIKRSEHENIQFSYQHLSYIDKVKYEYVAYSQIRSYLFNKYIEKHYSDHLSKVSNERYFNIEDNGEEIEAKFQSPNMRYQILGSAINCEIKQNKKDVCLKQKEKELAPFDKFYQLSQFKKRNYEIVGYSSNKKYSNDIYEAKENEKGDNQITRLQAVMNFYPKDGNSQINYHLNNNNTFRSKKVKEELQFTYTAEKRENQLIENCKYFKYIYGTTQNEKQGKQNLLYYNNENKKRKSHLNNYNQLSRIKTRELKLVGNTTNCQCLTNYEATENRKEAEQIYQFNNELSQTPNNIYKIVIHTLMFLSDTENKQLCHTNEKHKKTPQFFYNSSQNFTHHYYSHRQNQHFKRQLKYKAEYHDLSVFYMFCYYCCWHAVCGFPFKSREIFKHLKDLIVRKLTWLKTLPSLTDYNNDAPSALCGRKLTKPTRKVKVDIIANQQNCAQRSQNSTQKTKSTFTTTESSSLHFFKSSYSSSLSATSSRMTLATTTPYCHYQQQQQQPHHHYIPTTATTTTATIITTTPYLKLPSLLLLSRTLIILILLSSLWHTSEGFHSTGVKLSSNTVKTKYGLVRGIVVRSSPSLVEAYLGIPYASPPVGSLRFMPPITPSTWKNVRNADRFSPVCPQTVPIPPNGPEALLEVPRARLAQLRRLLPLLSNQSEDCLYLNIYAPYENRRHRRFTTNSGESNDSPKLPTILFIHGESYEWNSGNPYDGSELAAHGNVIVVTINFRLGIFGFLKTGGKESAQGNFGLMDLVAGLHWLKENLPAFGGDPQAITLLGHGTGAALANILAVSPVASDLIQHSVLVSGSALSPWAIQKNPLFVKRRVAEQTGCHGDMLYDDLAPCLRTKMVKELLAVKIDHPRFLVGFAPFIDGTVISPNTDYIGKLSLPLGSAIVSTSGIEFANFPKRNLIFCLTSVESHLDLSAQDLEFGFNETRRDRILRTYVRNNFHYHLNEIFAVLKNEYTDWDKAIRSPLSSRDATLQFLSDGHTASSLIKLGYMHSLRGGRGYFLHFKHRTIEEEYPQRTGSVRGEDVPFWLGLPISPLFPHNYTTQEKQISRLMLRYLANFAKTGNPNQSTVSSPLPSSSSLIGASSSSPTSPASEDHQKVKRSSSSNIVNSTSLTRGPIVVDVATATAREALNLAVLYNQRRTKRTYNKRHSRSNDDNSDSGSSEISYFSNVNSKLDGDDLPFWDAYDVVNQLYMELGNKAEIQSHYRGHKLSMWLNLIPQLHRHANMKDQSMRHHQFQDDLNNLNLYEGIVRAQTQIKPTDDEDTLLLPKGRTTPPPPVIQETNTTQKPSGGTTECGVDGAMFIAEMTTTSPSDNRSLVLDSREKEMATASTGLIGNLEVLRRLSGKQFPSYTTALVATVAVGCFLLILNILIFAGIYHQREKRARDAKTKEELQDNDTSKNSSILKLNAMGSETGSFNGSGAGVSGKTTVVFGEYSCYDEKSLQAKDEKLVVELPPPQMLDSNWATCSTSTLDLLKTKHHMPLEATYPLSNVVPITTTEQQQQTEHLMAVNAMEMSTYNPLPMGTGLMIDPSVSAAATSSGLLSKRGSFIGSSSQLNQYDFASVQSSDQMSFKDIENAVKVSVTRDDDITQDDDIPEPPPPPRSFQSMQHQQAQHNLQLAQQQQATTTNVGTLASGASGGGGGILRQAGTSSATQTGGGKKRVHIQEISV